MNEIICGDCLDVMAAMPDNSVDSIVTDPPYGLAFMGKNWDKGVPGEAFWVEALRVAKPGAHILAFGGTRTYHRLAVAIEDAGWEIRDMIQWVYGSGFPKSLDVGKAIDKAAGAEREVVGNTRSGISSRSRVGAFIGGVAVEEMKHIDITAPATPDAQKWDGWGTALKPANEPLCLARKPFKGTVAANVLQWGTGGINIDGCRVELNGDDTSRTASPCSESKDRKTNFNASKLTGTVNNSWSKGRFPANFIHDGSEEVLALFPYSISRAGNPNRCNHKPNGNTYFSNKTVGQEHNDSGSAARFFYCAKASASERNMGLSNLDDTTTTDGRKKDIDNPFQRGKTIRKNGHPTVKPLSLMRYLCRLITPPGGVVLDPFSGSGTTLIAAKQEGFGYIGIELSEEYVEIAEARLSAVTDRQNALFATGAMS